MKSKSVSPIIYFKRDFYNDLLEVSKNYFDIKKELGHYLSMCENDFSKMKNSTEQFKLKRYFYVIRALLAAKWAFEEKSVPPVLFETLVETKLNDNLKPIINELLEIKKNSSESNYIYPIKELNDFIEEELIKLKKEMITLDNSIKSFDDLNNLFIKGVKNYDKL